MWQLIDLAFQDTALKPWPKPCTDAPMAPAHDSCVLGNNRGGAHINYPLPFTPWPHTGLFLAMDEADEPLLAETKRRFVLFPIQYHDVCA